MENSYGIGITNRYAFFNVDDDVDIDDPTEALTQVQNEKKAKKEAAKASQVNKPPAPRKDLKKDDNDNKENRNNQRFEGKKVMDARKPQDGPREDRVRPNQEGGAPRRDFDDENRRGRGGRGGGRGMGRGRGGGEGGMRREGGGGGNRDGAFRGKREFERKSGDGRTGVKAEEKRGGGGKGNWGTIEDELKGETEDGNVTIDENAAPKEDGEKTEETIEKVIEEEEPKQLTLDEWKALQKGAVDQPSFNIRKAGEGANIDPKWKKAAAYMKEKEDDADETGYAEYVVSQRANKVKHINVDLHFADQQSGGRGGGRGRGGRGRGGRGGRGGGRDGDFRRTGGDKPQQFSLDDSKAFPALG